MSTEDSGPEPRRERDRDLHRYLTFVDAVAAIALTLLVLPLSDLGADLADGGSVADLFRDHESQFLAFLLSFVVIGDLWFVQYRAMRPVVTLHPIVARALLAWTFTIAVLPFCTELVARSGGDPISRICYFATIALSEACIGVAMNVTRRHPETTDPTLALPEATGAWVTVVLLLAGLALSLAVPALGYSPLLLLVAGRPLRDEFTRRRRHSGQATTR